MPKRHISIKISGTPVRKGGFIPIVNINDAFFETGNTYPQALTCDACLYSVSVGRDCTVYRLVFNRMRHHGDGAPARLVIGFSVPAGLALPADTDAVGVLHQLLESFVRSFAVALPDGSFEYRLGRLDTSSLENICRSIELVASQECRTVMDDSAPRGVIETAPDRIARTLADIGRSDLAHISELLVGEHINASLAGNAVILREAMSVAEPVNADIEPTPASDDTYGTPEAVAADVVAGAASDTADDSAAPVAAYDETAAPVAAYDETADTGGGSGKRRRTWPVLLAGIIAGACAALVAVGLLSDNGATNGATAADSVVTAKADTVSDTSVGRPAAAVPETVYVERKVIVEAAPAKTPKRRGKATHAAGAVTPAPEAVTPAPDAASPEDGSPAPELKYDPEAERSL